MTNGNDSGDQPGGDWQQPSNQAGGGSDMGGQPPGGTGEQPPGGSDMGGQPPGGTGGQPPGGGQDLAPAPAGGPDGVHPFADNNFNVNAFVEACKLVFDRAMDSNVLKAFVALTLIPFAWNLFVAGITVTSGFVSGTVASIVGIMLSLFGILLIPLFIFVSATQIALERPLAHRVFDRTVDPGSIVDTLKGVLSKVIWVFLASIIVSLGTTLLLPCCLLGLAVAFFLAQSPYLVAVHDRGVIESLSESFERGKKHWHLVVLFFAPLILLGLITWGIVGVGSVIVGFIPYVGTLLLPVFQWLGSLIVGVAAFILGTAAFTNIDELEGIATIDR